MHLTPTPQVTSGDTNPRYRRGIVAVAAALIVAGLFAVAFQLVSGIRPRQQAPAPTHAPLAGGWQLAGQFPSRTGERVAAAQSYPHVVYRLNYRTFAMERSGDGGATWHAIAMPAEIDISPLKTYAVFDISPLDANTVYLTAFGDSSSPPNCPSPFLPGGQGKRDFSCSLQYVSTNGGARWQRLMLPSQGRLTGMLSQVLGLPRAPLLRQGNRAYSLLSTDAVAGGYHLVVSSDGVNWQTADENLIATGLRIEDYLASPTGATVWTVMSDGGLWRSDDAGKVWVRSGDLLQGTGLAAARTVDGASFLYLKTGSPPLGDIAPADVRGSADGGKTWQAAPARGVPDGQRAARFSALTRADGTVVMLFRTPQVSFVFDEGTLHAAAYYAWKPGAKSWTRLTPTFDAEAVEQQWLAPAVGAGAIETVWALIYRDDMLTYEGNDTYIKDGTYTITGCGLGP